jgi:hypothetical protein
VKKQGLCVVAVFERRPDADEAADILMESGIASCVEPWEGAGATVAVSDDDLPRAARLLRAAGAAGFVVSPGGAPPGRAAGR